MAMQQNSDKEALRENLSDDMGMKKKFRQRWHH
jgi:hypothetical protein